MQISPYHIECLVFYDCYNGFSCFVFVYMAAASANVICQGYVLSIVMILIKLFAPVHTTEADPVIIMHKSCSGSQLSNIC